MVSILRYLSRTPSITAHIIPQEPELFLSFHSVIDQNLRFADFEGNVLRTYVEYCIFFEIKAGPVNDDGNAPHPSGCGISKSSQL